MEGLGLPTPALLKGVGPAYFAFAFAEDEEEQKKQALALVSSVEQLQRLVHGEPDEANRAVFEVSVQEVDCDETLMLSLMALMK